MKRAAAYARVSSDHQSETSIETQLKTIREFCKSHNIAVIDEYFEKQSGADSLNERKEFTKMIEKALNGAYDLVVVDKFDRFFRNDVEDRIVTRRLEEKGVLVLSATEGVDVSSPTGRLMRWIISDINSFYRDNLRSEIQRKVIAVAKKGYWLGGKPPLGYKLKEVVDSEGRHRKKLALDENEAPIIRFIFEQFNSGMSYRKVAQALNEKGVKTRRGKEFNANSVYEIICNPRYFGANVYNRGKKKQSAFS